MRSGNIDVFTFVIGILHVVKLAEGGAKHQVEEGGKIKRTIRNPFFQADTVDNNAGPAVVVSRLCNPCCERRGSV